MVFGEVKRNKRKNKRSWKLGDKSITECNSTKHLGITLTSDMSSALRIKEACNKGKGIYFSLMQAGVKPNAINPIISANVWKKVGEPAMLYGCELWQMQNSDTALVERTQRFIAKSIQGLNMRTHNEIACGLLGWNTVLSVIETRKLALLERIIHKPIKNIVKNVFLQRLYDALLAQTVTKQTVFRRYINDVILISKKYGLYKHLLMYTSAGPFPFKQERKRTCKMAISGLEALIWHDNLRHKVDCSIVQSAMHGPTPHLYYSIGRKNIELQRKMATIVRQLASPIQIQPTQCALCQAPVEHLFTHRTMYCTSQNDLRESMFNAITDELGIPISYMLNQLSDIHSFGVLLGGPCDSPVLNHQTHEELILTIVPYIYNMIT
jgi:hypothetical protein